MSKWTTASLGLALQQEITFPVAANGISIDTRTLNSGDIFIALQGNNDGHLHIAQAFEKGAAFVIAEYLPKDFKEKNNVLVVQNTIEALQKLGAYQRSVCKNLKAIAVTGSVGKTTTKEMLGQVLQGFGETVYSKASYNNHLGVPLTLAELALSTNYGVFEIGMNHPGEIAPLSKMAQPDVAIITTVAPSHIGNMGSLEAIADEKSDIFTGLRGDSTALFDGDSPLFERMFSHAKKYHAKNIFMIGKKKNAHAQLLECQMMQNGEKMLVKAEILGKIVTYNLYFFGEHYALNSLYVLLCAEVLGLDLKDFINYLEKVKPVIGRGQILNLKLQNNQSIVVFDDAYNANPASMRAGLNAFCAQLVKGRRIAIIGQMGELGSFSKLYHQEIGDLLNSLPVDIVYAVGRETKVLYDTLNDSKKGNWFETIDPLKKDFLSLLKGNDSIFIKGSLSQRLQEIVTLFKTELSVAT